MQGSPEILSVKRTRAKPKDAAGTPVPVRKSRKKVAKAPATATIADTTAGQTPADTPDLTPHIAIAAYFLAAARQFAPGHELDDWLQAERMLRMGAAG